MGACGFACPIKVKTPKNGKATTGRSRCRGHSIIRVRVDKTVFDPTLRQGQALMFDLHASTILTNAIGQKKTNGAPTNSQRPSLLKRMKAAITMKTQTAATPKPQTRENGVMNPRSAVNREDISSGAMVVEFLTVVS